MSSPRRPWAAARELVGGLLLAASIGLTFALLTVRVLQIDASFGAAVGCEGCFHRSVVVHDMSYLSAILLLLVLGFRLRRRWLALPLRLLALSALLIYAADIVVSRELFARLRFGDVMLFGADPLVLKKHLDNTGLAGDAMWLAVGAGLGLALLFLCWPCLRSLGAGLGGRLSAALMTLATLGIVAGQMLFPGQYVHDWGLRNVLAENLNTGVSQPYGAATVQAVLSAPPHVPQCSPGRGQRDDVIVLVLESWSSYQSALFGGVHDWTPELDAIARDNAYFTAMHAAGFTTNEGLMSLLTGMELLSPVKAFSQSVPFETTWGQARTLPRLLRARGYVTSFLTTGNLAFTRKGEWARDLGFEHVEGHDHPAYDGLPRLHFDSAPDAALYQRALAHLDEMAEGAQGRPRLLLIESVSSHHPYVHPDTGERAAEAVFRYMDASAAAFYRALQARGFFEHGQLLVISDHRAMVPVGVDERERMGRAVLSRIPALWAGKGVSRARVELPFHQADLLETLDRATASEFCGEHGVRDLQAPTETRPRCLYHARGDTRDLVDVFCPDGEGTIRLHGDATRMEQAEGLGRARSRAVVDALNRYRILRDRHQSEWESKVAQPD